VHGCFDLWSELSRGEFIRRILAGETPFGHKGSEHHVIAVVYHSDEFFPYPNDRRCIMAYSDVVLTDYPKARCLLMLRRKVGLPLTMIDELSASLNVQGEAQARLAQEIRGDAPPVFRDLAHGLIKPFCSIHLGLQRWEDGFDERARLDVVSQCSPQKVEQAYRESRSQLYLRFKTRGPARRTIEGFLMVDPRTRAESLTSWLKLQALLPEIEPSFAVGGHPVAERYLAAMEMLLRLGSSAGSLLVQTELQALSTGLDPFRHWHGEFVAAVDELGSFYASG
jgi:hypothetical protein